MSHYEILPLIQESLNTIIGNGDINSVITLYKLSALIKTSSNEDYIKLFAIYYQGYYRGRFEIINGIKSMSDKALEEIKTIMIESLRVSYKNMKNKKGFENRYEEKKNSFINLSIAEIRSLIIDELLTGINTVNEYLNRIEEIANSIDYVELSRLEKIDIDFEFSKLKDKRKYKYTEEGNYEDDENVLNIVENNLNKRGYTSHHLHLFVYEEIDNAIKKIVSEKEDNYQKRY